MRATKCPACSGSFIVDHGDFRECEDCGCEIDAPTCDVCNLKLEFEGGDWIVHQACEDEKKGRKV